MNVFAKFDEIPLMLLQNIKETKRYGHTFVRSFVRTDNVKTVYPPTNTVCGGYKKKAKINLSTLVLFSVIHFVVLIMYTKFKDPV